MSHRQSVHVVRDMPVTDVAPGTVRPFSTVDLRVFYPLSESGFSGAVTGLGIAYHKAMEELRARYQEFEEGRE